MQSSTDRTGKIATGRGGSVKETQAHSVPVQSGQTLLFMCPDSVPRFFAFFQGGQEGCLTEGRTLSLPIDITAMPNSHNYNYKALRLHEVEDTVVPHSDPMQALSILQVFFDPGGYGLSTRARIRLSICLRTFLGRDSRARLAAGVTSIRYRVLIYARPSALRTIS